MNKIKHLAIIMDGNGRWAQKNGLLRTSGHEFGAKKIEPIIKVCMEEKIQNLTLYAFSTENWKRPKSEINFLINLFGKFMSSQEDNFKKYSIKFDIFGDIDIFEDRIKQQIHQLKDKTKENKRLNLNIAVNYGSRNEIVRACKKISALGIEFNEKNISSQLDTGTCGDVDLLIRTGGEQRVSNFLLWQISYAELYFSKTLWPDFDTCELKSIIDNFKKKNRRFGGL